MVGMLRIWRTFRRTSRLMLRTRWRTIRILRRCRWPWCRCLRPLRRSIHRPRFRTSRSAQSHCADQRHHHTPELESLGHFFL
jgi:hypothetical protein